MTQDVIDYTHFIYNMFVCQVMPSAVAIAQSFWHIATIPHIRVQAIAMLEY